MCVGFRLHCRYRYRLSKCWCFGSATIFIVIVIVYRLFLRLSYRNFFRFDIQPYLPYIRIRAWTKIRLLYTAVLVQVSSRFFFFMYCKFSNSRSCTCSGRHKITQNNELACVLITPGRIGNPTQPPAGGQSYHMYPLDYKHI